MLSDGYLLGRQPILDKNHDLVGFDLLFRSVASREDAAVPVAQLKACRRCSGRL